MSTTHSNETSHRSLALIALAVGAGALVLALLGGSSDAQRFFQAYLWAFHYWWLVSIGCLGLALIYQLTGGRWGEAAWPAIHAGTRTLPLVAVAFIPIALNLDQLYSWTAPGFFEGEPHTENRQWYFTTPFFLGRAAAYLIVPIVLAFAVTRAPAAHQAPPRRRPWLGAFGAVLAVLIVTFAAIDWAMSLEPFWFSTIYGGLFIVGALLSAMSFVTATVAWRAERGAVGVQPAQPTEDALHDLGNLVLAMLMLWAYFAFSQWLIIYSGNLPWEAVWYTRRLEGGWQFVALALIVLHFAVPFGLLLPRENKRNARALAAIATGIAIVRALDVYWMIVPAFAQRTARPDWRDVILFLGLGGIWMFVYLRVFDRRHARQPLDEQRTTVERAPI